MVPEEEQGNVENDVDHPLDDNAEGLGEEFSPPPSQSVGERLAEARREQGMDLTTIAERTRVPIRHLEAIEKSDYAALPGTTYSLGFARSYARTLGLDASAIGSDMRRELTDNGYEAYQTPSQTYEPADPSRVPPLALAWTAAGIAAVLLIGYFVWRSIAFDGGAADEAAIAEEEVAETQVAASPAADAPAPSGQVTLTANDTVWVRIYDAKGDRLYEKEMQKGDSYNVPEDADNPMINTGRAQAIDVTIGGKKVESLGPADLPILDVGVSAAALAGRGKETEAESGAASQSGQ